MRSNSFPWLLAVVALLSACSLLVDFDPEGQPCDAQSQCLEDYVCRDGGCVSMPGARPDGGTRDGGTDGGTRDGGRGLRSLCEDPADCPELAPDSY